MNMIFVVFLVGLTSAFAYKMTTRISPRTRSMADAMRSFFDWIGMFVLFLAANLVLGAGIIYLIRGLTPQFVPLYALQNFLLLILSAAQAFVFHQWWKHD